MPPPPLARRVFARILARLIFGMPRQQPFGGLAGLTGGAKNRPIVLAQHLQP